MTNDLRDRVAAAMWKSRGNGGWSDAQSTAIIAIYRNMADAAIAVIQAENQELRLQCLAHEGQAQEAYAAQQRAEAKLAKAVEVQKAQQLLNFYSAELVNYGATVARLQNLENAWENLKVQSEIAALKGGEPQAGIEQIAAERKRQIGVEGWTTEHDDLHPNGEIARAAACYAMQAALDDIGQRQLEETVKHAIRELWPWASGWWKPKTQRQDLVRAGALIAAELDRLDRKDTTE